MTKQLLFHFFFFLLLVTVFSKTQGSNLVVTDNKSNLENFSYLIKFTDEPLELTCRLRNVTEEQISLTWVLPSLEHNETKEEDGYEEETVSQGIVLDSTGAENGSVKLYINSLQRTHSGSYMCESVSNTSGTLNQTVELIVKSKKVLCGKKFECGDNQCISIIYKCDGVADCRNKSDEAPELCGVNPCEGRVRCGNGRCIPNDWCKVCDSLKKNCTNKHRHDCCPALHEPYPRTMGMPYTEGSHPRRFHDYPDIPNVQHQYDINFIQTTIYTIIGCSLVFMIIVTVLVIAICRVHLKRSQPAQVPNNRGVFATTAYHRAFTQEIGVYDVDMALRRSDGPGLLVTYNINNGVQIVGSPVEPPPYSEVASLPPREGPPPPYALSPPYVGESVGAVECEVSRKPPGRSFSPHARVSSEPSLPSLNRL